MEITVNHQPTGFTGKYSLGQREFHFFVLIAGTQFAGGIKPSDLAQLPAEFCTDTFEFQHKVIESLIGNSATSMAILQHALNIQIFDGDVWGFVFHQHTHHVGTRHPPCD